jgi:hypothetical protein
MAMKFILKFVSDVLFVISMCFPSFIWSLCFFPTYIILCAFMFKFPSFFSVFWRSQGFVPTPPLLSNFIHQTSVISLPFPLQFGCTQEF